MATESGAGDAIVRELRIEARPETVFAFLTQPEKIVEWMGRSATLEARAGGVFRVDYNGDDIARGEFVEVVPNERVVYTWGWEAEGAAIPPGGSVVEFALEPDGDGTLLRLRHAGLPGDEARSHGEGWDYFLPRLERAIAGRGSAVTA